MRVREKPEIARIRPGDINQRVGVEQITARGVNVPELVEKLIDAAAAEFAASYNHLTARAQLAGREELKGVCEDVRLRAAAHFEAIAPRLYELGGALPDDIAGLAARAPAQAVESANGVSPSSAALQRVLESERAGIRAWSEICELTFGKDPRSHDLAARILGDKTENEALLIEALAYERDGTARPSGQVRRTS